MTPVVGILSDMFDTPCGKRTPWYIFGTIFVIPTFLGIFIYPPGINDVCALGEEGCTAGEVKNPTLQAAWYITLPALFNVGWAAVQISNMSIVNTISKSNRMRDKLSNSRNGFTSTANIVVLLMATVLFLTVDDRIEQFRILCVICICLGTLASIFYLMQVREVPLKKLAEEKDAAYKRQLRMEAGIEDDGIDDDEDELKKVNTGKKWFEWLKVETFYIYGMVYMFVRVAINVTMTMQPFYLTYVTEFGNASQDPDAKVEEEETPVQVAIVPLISYIGQLVFSLLLQRKLTEKLRSRFLPLLVALVLISIGSFPLALLNGEENIRWMVYPLAFTQGLGLIIMLNTSTSLISDVIGSDSANAAFVYGVYSFFDKLANGSLLYFMVESYSKDAAVLRWIMAITPIVCSVGSLLLSYIGHKYFSHKLAKITGIIHSK